MFEQKIHDAFFGLAVGDALGVPVEFRSRALRKKDPVIGMRGYGTHTQPVGTWSDDTSMTLAAWDSLKNGLDTQDIMARFLAWANDAAYTATDTVFDIGISTGSALNRFQAGTPADECGAKDVRSNGNGSLMRILPAVFYCEKFLADAPVEERIAVVNRISALTHAHPISLMGCGIYAFIAWELMENPSMDAVRLGLGKAKAFYTEHPDFANYERIFQLDFAALPESVIKSSGYVVDSLEAALWCLLNTDSYAACTLAAVNLGDDTDTIAAIAGGLAGLLYGMDAIPQEWLGVLKKPELIEKVCG